MKRTKRIVGLLLCIAMLVPVLAGCGGNSNTDTSSAPPTASETSSQAVEVTPASSAPPDIVAAPSAAPTEADVEFVKHLTMTSESIAVIDLFNPAFQSAWILIVCHMMFDTLMYRNYDNVYEPRLALEWGTDDGQTYWFKLREGVYFHNGELFTASDVAYMIDRVKDTPGVPSYDTYKQIKSYEIINDYEITVTLEAINVEFIAQFATCSIANKKAYDDDPEKGGWIGTGPWIVESFVPTERIEMVRNENFWGEKPVTERFTWIYVAEATAQLIMLENGDVQLSGISNTNVPIYENDPRFQIRAYVMNNCNYLAFNMMKPVTADINFRKAVAHALVRQEIVDIAVGGYGATVDHGTIWGYRIPFKGDDIPQIPYDLEAAKACLEASGYKGETIQLVAGMSHTIATAQVVQQQLSKIGINVEIFDTDPPTLATYVTWGHTGADIVVNSAVFARPSSVRSYLMPGMNANTANYENPEMNRLLDEVVVTVDEAAREKLYREIQQIIADDIPYVGTMHMGMNRIEAAGVGGVVYFPDNNWDFRYTYMVKQD